jgi:rhodanese-related sulfurtransferase
VRVGGTEWLIHELRHNCFRRSCAVDLTAAAGLPHCGATEGPMAQDITWHVAEMVAVAEREIETLPVADAIRLHGAGEATFVDLRDIRELDREGRIPGAFHCPRGMLEFWLDPASKYHKPVFAAEKKFVFFCAGGARSALAAQTAQRMGLKPVAHIGGGFGAWREAGGPVDMHDTRKKES